MICGHSAQKDGRIWLGDGWSCIDTCVYRGMFLTVLDVGNDLVYQARQTGEFRGPISLAESTELV